MNQADKAEALQWIARILHLTRPTIELDNLRALIERQPDDTDGEMWRFCVKYGFPIKFGSWYALDGVTPYFKSAAETVQAAMAAMNGQTK